jgi:hypothetical protein
MLVFRPSFVNYCPSPSLQSPPPSLPCLNKYRSKQCITEGGGDRVAWIAYTGVIHCVLDQIPNLQNCFIALNKKLGGEGVSYRKTPAAKYLYWSIFKKSDILDLSLLVIWSMPPTDGFKKLCRIIVKHVSYEREKSAYFIFFRILV